MFTRSTPYPVIVFNASGLRHPPRATVENVIRGDRLPYHAIIPLGLFHQWAQKGDRHINVCWWGAFAILLEHALNRWSTRPEAIGPNGKVQIHMVQNDLKVAAKRLTDKLACQGISEKSIRRFKSISPPVLGSMLRESVAAGVCSFDQIVTAAVDYLTRDKGRALLQLCGQAVGLTLSSHDVRRVMLTTLREGHTSSVLRVAVYHNEALQPILFGLNVARDLTEASRDLRSNQEHLNQWTVLDPDGVAEVYDAGYGRFQWFGQERRLLVLAARWFEDARELHVVRTTNGGTHGRFVQVNEFRHDFSPLPDIIGEMVPAGVSDDLWERIVAQRTRLAQFDWHTKTLTAPQIELNHGDVVARLNTGVTQIAFVGCEAQNWYGPIAAWPYEVALSSANDDMNYHRRLYWGKPVQAVNSVYQALRERPPRDTRDTGQPVGDYMIQAASVMRLEEVTEILGLPNGDSTVSSLLVETRRVLESCAKDLMTNHAH